MRIDALAERIDTTEREVDDDLYHIWTKKLPVSELGDVKLVIAEKETDEDEENPVKYLATNKIDAPTAHIIRSYGMRWRIETFFEDSKQDLGFGDCEMQLEEGASRHWHLLMAAYSFLRLDPESSVLGTVRSKASFERTSNTPSKKPSTTSSRGSETRVKTVSTISWPRLTTSSFTQRLILTCKAESQIINCKT